MHSKVPIISMTEFNQLYIAGDLNYEESRNTKHCRMIKEFKSEYRMYSLWSEFDVDFTFCHENENQVTSLHTLDHFLVLERSRPHCQEAGVLHHPENLSDHEPIYAIIDCPEASSESIEDPIPRFDWEKCK